MNTILLLTDFRLPGTQMAARYLSQALERHFPSEMAVQTADPLAALEKSKGAASPYGMRRVPTLESAPALLELLSYSQPRAVVIFSPVFGPILEPFWRKNPPLRPSAYLAAITTFNPHANWGQCRPDLFTVANPMLAELLSAEGIAPEEVQVTGPLVAPIYSERDIPVQRPDLAHGGRPHLLVFPPNDRNANAILGGILLREDWDITLVSESNPKAQARARRLAELAPNRTRVVSARPAQIPSLALSHHVAVGAVPASWVNDLVCAGLPCIVWERGTEPAAAQWEFLNQLNAGRYIARADRLLPWVERAFTFDGRLLHLWRTNITELNVSGGPETLARLIVSKINSEPASWGANIVETPAIEKKPPAANKRLLLCDFHTHTTWSDGKLSVRELVDFYGQRKFDCLCITDHLCDPKHLLGKLVNLTGLVIPLAELAGYFAEIESEKARAWETYELLLLTGVEFNRDGYRPKSSTHLLGVDLKQPIDPVLSLKQIIMEIKSQGALAIASHPLPLKSHWAKNTLHLWENVEEYAPLLDAWEVANRDDIFNPIGLKKLPIIANSDFHKPQHIQSWKTMLYCAKDAESIKSCIRENQDVFLTLYRKP